MKNFVNILLLVSLFNAFSTQAMEKKSGDSRRLLLNVNSDLRTPLEKELLDYKNDVVGSVASMGRTPDNEFAILFLIASEFDKEKYGNSLQKFIDIIAKKNTAFNKDNDTKKIISLIKQFRSKVIKKTEKTSTVRIILEKTKGTDRNVAVAAYFEFIKYALAIVNKDQVSDIKDSSADWGCTIL